MKRLVGILLFLLCLAPLVSVFKIEPCKSAPTTIIVPDNYPTIQEGINHANTGDTVYIKTGIYHENVNVNKTVTLQGATFPPSTVIEGGNLSNAVAVEISSNGVILRGLETRVGGAGSVHILINQTRDVYITESIVTGAGVVASPITGIQISSSVNTTLDGNDLMSVTGPAISMYNSTQSLVTGNNITQNAVGISLNQSDSNTIFANKFLNNTAQASVENSTCVWDNGYYGYPQGGNFWSDYKGFDIYQGPQQNILGSDGIGDTPYIIDASNRDRYPLVKGSPFQVHNMNTGLEYQTIQEAINANETLDGDTLLVNSGSHFENVVVNKSLTLLGVSSETTWFYGTGNVVTIAADNVTITGFSFRIGSLQSVGLFIDGHSGADIHDDNFTNDVNGIELSSSSNNTIFKNLIVDNQIGILIENGSTDNILTGNMIEKNDYGVWLDASSSNKLFHNSFLNNKVQVYPGGSSINVWNDAYPSGGNYWSDYNGTDLYSGPYQNETGPDGIGDAPYIIDLNNTDNYPLMGPWTDIGTNITVTHSSGVSLTFDNVTSSGITTVNVTQTGPDPPQGYVPVSETPLYYNISTTANYSGTIELNIPYNQTALTGQNQILQVMRWNDTTQQWTNITTVVDAQDNLTMGITNHLSLYAIFVSSRILGDINHDGVVNILDAILLSNAFDSHGPNYDYAGEPASPTWNANADLNSDGIVNILDAIILANNFLESVYGTS